MIRRGNESDLAVILDIEAQCFTSCWSEAMFRYEINENEFGSFYVYEEDGKIVGFIDFWITFEECQLAKIAVQAEYRRKGIAHLMMQEMEKIANQEGCERIMLEVRVSNAPAKALYEQYDFMTLNIRKGYYSDNGEDALVMCKALGGGCV